MAHNLGMEVLFESHNLKEIDKIPADIARIWGVNCRKLDSKNHFFRYNVSRLLKSIGRFKDFSVNEAPFALSSKLPKGAIKVAESGMSPRNIRAVRDDHGYNAALVGNSLLLCPQGIDEMLNSFAAALAKPVAHRPEEQSYFPVGAGAIAGHR